MREESEGMTWARDDGRGRARVCLKVVVVVAVAWGRRRRWDILLDGVCLCVCLIMVYMEDRRLSALFLFGGWSLNVGMWLSVSLGMKKTGQHAAEDVDGPRTARLPGRDELAPGSRVG